jgi:hypothetical protein
VVRTGSLYKYIKEICFFFKGLMGALESRNLQGIKPCLFDIIKVTGEYNKYIA